MSPGKSVNHVPGLDQPEPEPQPEPESSAEAPDPPGRADPFPQRAALAAVLVPVFFAAFFFAGAFFGVVFAFAARPAACARAFGM